MALIYENFLKETPSSQRSFHFSKAENKIKAALRLVAVGNNVFLLIIFMNPPLHLALFTSAARLYSAPPSQLKQWPLQQTPSGD